MAWSYMSNSVLHTSLVGCSHIGTIANPAGCWLCLSYTEHFQSFFTKSLHLIVWVPVIASLYALQCYFSDIYFCIPEQTVLGVIFCGKALPSWKVPVFIVVIYHNTEQIQQIKIPEAHNAKCIQILNGSFKQKKQLQLHFCKQAE